MSRSSWSEKFKERKIGQTLAVYLGSAWVFIEAFNFLIDKYRWNAEILDIIILLVIFGFPALLIYAWFHQKFTRKAIILQILNGLIAISLIGFNLLNPESLNPTQLRLLKFKDNQQKLAEAIRSIAILPFANYTGDENQDYLASGMHDALISELGRIGAIRVISKTTTLSYANSQKTIKEIASELHVDAIIEASILGTDENIMVQLKLLSAFPEEHQLWAQTFDTDMTNIRSLYSRVIKNIASEIQLTLSPDQEIRLNKTRQVNPESYKAYLRGMYHIYQLTPESITRGMEYLQEAIRLDPADPFAYAGLALGYLEIAHGPLDPGDALPKAEAAASQALKLDSTIAEVYSAFAEVYLYELWEFEKAEKYFKKALELNPNLAITHYHYAWALYLFGRMEEAIVEHKLAQKYDPFNPKFTAWLGALYCYDGRYEDAIKEALKSFDLQKDYPAGYYVLGETYSKMGRADEAIEAHKKLFEVFPGWPWALGRTYAISGFRDEAEKILNELEKSEITPWNAYGLTVLNAALGNFDEAFNWLAYEPHHGWLAWLAVMPEGSTLYDDLRFKDFIKRLDLPD